MKKQLLPRKRVFVGLSGGVDSSVSAALLKKAGYDVTGVFIRVWDPRSDLGAGERSDLFDSCQSKEDRLDAMRVCAKLGIPFLTLDLSKEYKKEVVDYMVREYKAGRTPNPDVMCNRYVKFGGVYKFARESGADYVATGHYARIGKTQNTVSKDQTKHKTQNSKLQTTNRKLKTGSDQNKDQSYFLWTLTQEQLAHTLFPVGGLTKPEVRKLAKKFGLPTADKKDSQGLCFLGKIDVKQFLKNFIKPKRGKIQGESGEVIGEHDGAFFFTLGERHGFEVAKKTHDDKPYYIIGKDIKKNILIVSHNPHKQLDGESRKIFELKNVNWINDAPAKDRPTLARIRYRQPLQKCRTSEVGHFEVHFEESQTGGAAGQSIVIYDGEVCLGGGIIV